MRIDPSALGKSPERAKLLVGDLHPDEVSALVQGIDKLPEGERHAVIRSLLQAARPPHLAPLF